MFVASEEDEASVRQRAALLALAPWTEAAPFEGRPVQRRGETALVSIREHHLYRDHLDRDLAAFFSEPIDLVVYLSKHRSESRIPSLTVHPVGNPGDANLGGKPRSLVPASPRWMTAAIRRLRAEAHALPYEVTFEATHHGPFLETPTFYIEQGSTEAQWSDPDASAAIARTLLGLVPLDAPVAVGIGGGHYVPRHTDLVMARRVAFGHLIPTMALEGMPRDVLSHAVERTPEASLAYLHRKSLGKPESREIEALLTSSGLRVVRESDLAPWEDKA